MRNAAKFILACDVGGTGLKIGLVRSGRVLARAELPAEPEGGLVRALERMRQRAAALMPEAALSSTDLGGAGLAFPGIIEPRTEKILSSPAGKFDDAASLDVTGWWRGHFDGPVVICNDANAALASEARWGAARDCPNVVMVTLGTGFGSSAIIDGVPLRGRHGQAGCLGGHLLANVHGRSCLCGNVGCVETEASTWMLPALLERQPGGRDRAWVRARPLGYAEIFQQAAAGDAVATTVRDESLRVWGAATVNLIHAYDPERVVIGGGIMRSAETILPALRAYVAQHAWTPWGKVELRAAELGEDAGLLGVAHLVEQRLTTATGAE